jgi:hypothetical protein
VDDGPAPPARPGAVSTSSPPDLGTAPDGPHHDPGRGPGERTYPGTVPIRRWPSWALITSLSVLTAGAAVWSVSSAPDVALTTSASLPTTPPGARLTARPKVVLFGQPVRLSGTDCPPGDEVLTGVTAPAIPNRRGSWKVDEPVGITYPVGEQNFGAYCYTRGGGSLVFSYPTVQVRVSMSPGARFTVSSKTLTVGGPVRLTGTECPRGDHVDTAFGDATPDAEGSWSFVGTVGQSSLIGSIPVDAECLATPRQDPVFAYRPVRTRVDTFRHLRVSPGPTVTAGTTTLTVDSVGPCPVGAGSFGGTSSGYWAEVDLTPVGRTLGASATADSIQQFVSGREWSAILSIPEGLGAGRYIVTATCVIQRLFLGYYSPLTITVSAG